MNRGAQGRDISIFLVGFEPVAAGAAGHFEGDVVDPGVFHLVHDELLHLGEFVGNDVEHEFVVYLYYHARAEAPAAYLGVDAYHGYLDYVGCRALYGRVDGVALGIASYGGVAREDVGEEAFAAFYCGDISVGAGALDRLFHVLRHLRI